MSGDNKGLSVEGGGVKRETEIEHMTKLLAWIEKYREEFRRNEGSRRSATFIPVHLKRGIVFYTAGYGWRLTKNWQSVLHLRMEVLTG